MINRTTISSIFLLVTPTIAMAIPVTYQFDALDWLNPDQTFSGSITFDSSKSGVRTSPASDPSYPGAFFYEDAILNITLNYGGTIVTRLGGYIYNDCTYDSSFSINTGSSGIQLAYASCLPGADQPDLRNLDLAILNDVIPLDYPALIHPGTNEHSVFAHPFNFKKIAPIPEPISLILVAFGVVAIGLVRRKQGLLH